MFIGETGSGKTTLIKSLVGYKMGMKKYENMNWLTIVEPVTDPKIMAMHSNPGSKSVTRHVVAIRPREQITREDILLVDSAGFSDTEGIEVQIANLINMKMALKGCRSIRIVIVISHDNWGARGQGIKMLGRTLSQLFNDFLDVERCILPVFNRYDDMPQLKAKI